MFVGAWSLRSIQGGEVFIKIGRFEMFAARDCVIPASAKRPVVEVIRRGGGGLDVRMFQWRAVFSWLRAHRVVRRIR
jgi:hypothetical protein